MNRKILDRFCSRCGFIFHGQRTGKCPSCDESAVIELGRLYKINPKDIRIFDRLDRKGGILKFIEDSKKQK